MEIPAEDSSCDNGKPDGESTGFTLEMPQKGKKTLRQKRIAYTFIATMAATLLIIGLINYFFLGSLYPG